jgi:hypothetical protein
MAGCTETVASNDCQPSSGSATSPSGASVDTSACSAAGDGAVAGLHRLTRGEYDNTVRDLLGDDTHPSADFPADIGANGFGNNADALSVSPLHFEAFDAAAIKLAATAMSGAARSRIVTCDPIAIGEAACAKQSLAAFAKRAWRRPVAADEVAELVALVDVAKTEGEGFDRGIELAVRQILVSPNFLFRVETDPDPASAAPHAVDDHALASRLSYFLWSSMPDDELFAAADAKKLGDPVELERQARRMLANPKSAALLQDFAVTWFIAPFAGATPSPNVYPAYDESLRQAMREETSRALQGYVFEDRSFLDLLDADTTWVNERLAKHYGMTGVTGPEFRQVSLVGTGRRGVVTQGSVLTMTSTSTRSSPTRRGNWVLTNVLCDPPPPPPENVPPLAESGGAKSVREALEHHRANPACAGCHSKMDPIGLALEHFDGVGGWRDSDRGTLIDAKTALDDGRVIDGATQLTSVLKTDPRVPKCATSKLLSYALGRVPRGGDECRATMLSQQFAASGYRMKELIVTLIKDDAFRMRHGGK